jgi:hypothetical protein
MQQKKKKTPTASINVLNQKTIRMNHIETSMFYVLLNKALKTKQKNKNEVTEKPIVREEKPKKQVAE